MNKIPSIMHVDMSDNEAVTFLKENKKVVSGEDVLRLISSLSRVGRLRHTNPQYLYAASSQEVPLTPEDRILNGELDSAVELFYYFKNQICNRVSEEFSLYNQYINSPEYLQQMVDDMNNPTDNEKILKALWSYLVTKMQYYYKAQQKNIISDKKMSLLTKEEQMERVDEVKKEYVEHIRQDIVYAEQVVRHVVFKNNDKTFYIK